MTLSVLLGIICEITAAVVLLGGIAFHKKAGTFLFIFADAVRIHIRNYRRRKAHEKAMAQKRQNALASAHQRPDLRLIEGGSPHSRHVA